MQAVSFTNCCW